MATTVIRTTTIRPVAKPPAPKAPKPTPGIAAQAVKGHPLWGGGPQGHPTQGPGAVKPGGPQPPAAQPQPPAAAPAPAPSTAGNELDPTYYNNVAKNNFTVQNTIQGLNLQNSQANSALQTALANLAYQEPRDDLTLMQKANAGGGLYSSVYNQNLGDLGHKYATARDAANTTYNNLVNTNAIKIAGLQGSIPLFNTGEAIASAGRLSAAAQNNPAVAPPPGAAPAGAPAPPKAKAKPPAKPAAKPTLAKAQKGDTGKVNRAQSTNQAKQKAKGK